MAFATSNLSVLAYTQGFTLWHYRGAGDGINDIAESEFFEEAGDLFAAGDMVLASAKDGGKVLCVTGEWGRPRTTALS